MYVKGIESGGLKKKRSKYKGQKSGCESDVTVRGYVGASLSLSGVPADHSCINILPFYFPSFVSSAPLIVRRFCHALFILGPGALSHGLHFNVPCVLLPKNRFF